MALFTSHICLYLYSILLILYRKIKSVFFLLFSLQTILGVPSLEEVISSKQVIPQYIMYNLANTNKHGIVILHDKSGWY